MKTRAWSYLVPLLAALSLASACESPKRGAPAPSAAASSCPSAPAFTVSAPLPVASPAARLEPLRQRTYAVAIEGTLAHVGTEAGVTVFDLQQPEAPKALADVVLPGSVNNLALLQGAPSRLAVAVGPSGLALVDASGARSGKLMVLNPMPWTPVQRGGCYSAWNAASSDKDKAFAACGTGGVAEVDLHSPADPKVTRVVPTDDYVRDVAVLDVASGVPAGKASPSLVAAAAGRAGLIVVDFKAAGAPRVVATVASAGDTRAVAVRGGLAYLAEGPAGLRVVDLRDPAKPVVVGSIRPESTDMIRGIALGPRTAWLCAGESGLMAIDITTPSSMRKVGGYDPELAVNRAALMGDTLVAANDAGGLLILNASDPSSPRVLHPKPGAGH